MVLNTYHYLLALVLANSGLNGVKIMALITWDKSLSVEIKEFDDQHKQLCDVINSLNEAMSQGKGKEVLGKIINDLIRYTQSHFKAEENYFDRFGYPDAEIHKTEHAMFVRKVSEFREDLLNGKAGLSIKIMFFLSDWLRKHIKGVDKKYIPFLKEKGL